MALSDTSVSLAVRAALSYSGDLASARSDLSFVRSVSLANGTGASQVDKIYSDTNTLGASATLDLDLAGALTDILGVALTFVKVKGIFVSTAPGNTNNVVMGAAAANQFVGPFGAATHTIAVPPGQLFAITNSGAGWVVTAATGDLLRFANSGAGTSVTYDVAILGTSA